MAINSRLQSSQPISSNWYDWDASNIPRALLDRIELVNFYADPHFLEVEATFRDKRGAEHLVKCEVTRSGLSLQGTPYTVRIPDETVLHLCAVA